MAGSNRIDIWNASYSRLTTSGGVYPPSAAFILSMAAVPSSSSQIVFCGMSDGTIRGFNVSKLLFYSVLSGHAQAVNALDIIILPPLNTQFLISCSDDGFVMIWNVTGGGSGRVKSVNVGASITSLSYFNNDTSISKSFYFFQYILI
jgi:WD40 repeat protein